MEPAQPQTMALPPSAMPPGMGSGPRTPPPPALPPGTGLPPLSVQPVPVAPLRPRPIPPPAAPATHTGAIAVGGAAVAVLLIGLGTYLAYPRGSSNGATTSNPDDAPAAATAAGPTPVEPLDYLGKAKSRALAWDGEAQLVSVEAGPVVAGKVRPGGGRIRYTFAKPGAKLGPGERVAPERLVVELEKGEQVKASEATVELATRSVGDPGCSVVDAWRATVASGVPSSAETKLTYELSEKFERAVWRAEATADPKHNRTLDGQRCTILTR